jgi:hypothetical protein
MLFEEVHPLALPHGPAFPAGLVPGRSALLFRAFAERSIVGNGAADAEALETAERGIHVTDVSSGGEPENARVADLRAATMLRETAYMSFDAATETALLAIATEMNMSRLDLIRMALGDWLESRNKVPYATNE